MRLPWQAKLPADIDHYTYEDIEEQLRLNHVRIKSVKRYVKPIDYAIPIATIAVIVNLIGLHNEFLAWSLAALQGVAVVVYSVVMMPVFSMYNTNIRLIQIQIDRLRANSH